MRRGTRVGQAYIALTADGSGINKDISDSMDEVDFDRIGDEHGQEYENRFRSHLDGISESFSVFLRDLGKAIDTDDNLTMGIRRQVNDAFTGGDLDSLTAGIGRRLGVSLGSEMQPEIERAIRVSVNDSLQKLGRSSDFNMSDLIRSLDSGNGSISIIGPIMDRAEAEARRSMEAQAREMISIHTEALRENAEHDRDANSERLRMYSEMFNQIEDRERESARVYQALLDGEQSAFERNLADRAQAEDDDARRRNRARIEYEQEFSRLLSEQEEERARDQDARDAQWSRMEQDRDNDRFRRFDQMARDMLGSVAFDPRIDDDKILASFRRLRADLEAQADLELRLNADLPIRERERIKAELEGIRARISVGVDEDGLNRSLLRTQGIIDRATTGNGGDGGGFGGKIGALLGAGSRNNFLNIIGKTIGNIVSGVEGLAKTGTRFFSTFSTGFNSLSEQASTFQRLLAGGGAAGGELFASIAASGPAALAAIVVATLAASVLVSVLSALLALAIALTATIAIALTGALIIGAAGLGAVAVAGGLAVAAFTSLTDAQSKALKADFMPLKEELTGIGQIVYKDLLPSLERIAPLLENALGLLIPLANVAGSALGSAGERLAASLSGPGFQLLSTALAVYLPSIITNLGQALGNLLDGLAGAFAAILPYVQQFSGYLSDVTARFDAFAASAKGQNSIADFMDRAVVSIQSLFSFLRELSGLIFDVLFSADAQNAGNGLFDSAAESLKGFRDKVQKAIDDGDFKKYFNDAIKFGGDLKDAIVSISDALSALNSSGVLEATGDAIKGFASVIETAANTLQKAFDIIDAISRIQIPNNPFEIGKYSVDGVTLDPNDTNPADQAGLDLGGILDATATNFGGATASGNFIGPTLADSAAAQQAQAAAAASQAGAIKDAQASGAAALAATSVENGGTKKKPEKPKYVNPYIAYANSLIKDAPSVAAAIKNAAINMNKAVANALRDAASAANAGAVQSGLTTQMESLRAAGKTAVNSAQDALSNAAQSLANATTKAGAKAALQKVKQSQKDLKATLANQKNLNKVAKLLAAQRVVTGGNVEALLNGVQVQNATLADYAAAREQITQRLTAANTALANAISLRDQYNQSVSTAVKAYGSLITAAVKTVNGVEQALTANDITTNLKDRLAQITAFNDNLQILLSQGLSNEAYQQIVDAGVEQGSAYAAALVQGGVGAIAETNGLTAQIGAVADSLGAQASDRLYQAGVDAAQGLVDGLTSLSAQLDSAATALGTSIANAVKAALGIASPSKVMKGITRNVGQTLIDGLGDEETDVAAAATRLLSNVSVSPEVAKYAQEQADKAAVSENQSGAATGDEHHWHIETPTTDPLGVAREAINEMTGRLT